MKYIFIFISSLLSYNLKFQILYRSELSLWRYLQIRDFKKSLYFPYFHSYVPQKSSKMDDYWIVMDFFGNKIPKCPSLMEKWRLRQGSSGILPKLPWRSSQMFCNALQCFVKFCNFFCNFWRTDRQTDRQTDWQT